MTFLLLTAAGFIGLEIISYAIHRWLFHGVFWRIHRTHHLPRRSAFELNDVFSAFFTVVSISLMVLAEKPWTASYAFPVGLGITLYGSAYFVFHDLFTHRRFFPFSSRNRLLLLVRNAHQRHHQSAEKQGLEPYGLFLFNYAGVLREMLRRSGKDPV